MPSIPASIRPLAVALVLVPGALHAQERSDDWLERCRRQGDGNGRATHCEVRETRLPARAALHADGGENGGVSVKAWDRDEVLVRSRIQAWAGSDDAARAVARRVRVSTDGTVRANGPGAAGGREGWAVSYEVFVPRGTDLSLKARNGGLSVDGVRGHIELKTQNGPLALSGVSGSVKGHTENGPLSVRLAGTRWEGDGLDVASENGPVSIVVPEGYSARLTTGTETGPRDIEIPLPIQGRMGSRFTADLGGGGAPLRIVTDNGPLTIRRP